MYFFQIIMLFLLTGVQEHSFKVFGQIASVGEFVSNFGPFRFSWPPIIWRPEKRITVTNHANDSLRIWCNSKDIRRAEQQINSGKALEFKIKPLFIGDWTVYWCTLDYMDFWARFDVYGSNAKYGFENANDLTYDFKVFNDGVYYKNKKIRGLATGQNKYELWEFYDSNNKAYGRSLTGFVDRDMCNDIPGWMTDKTSAVTVCDKACVTLYSELHCKGETTVLHGEGGCATFRLTYFNNRAGSVKGC